MNSNDSLEEESNPPPKRTPHRAAKDNHSFFAVRPNSNNQKKRSFQTLETIFEYPELEEEGSEELFQQKLWMGSRPLKRKIAMSDFPFNQKSRKRLNRVKKFFGAQKVKIVQHLVGIFNSRQFEKERRAVEITAKKLKMFQQKWKNKLPLQNGNRPKLMPQPDFVDRQ